MIPQNYCALCGHANETRLIEGRQRPVCPHCGTIHYENPRPAVTVIIVRDGQLLLVKRAVDPARGAWCLPGGFMEIGETAQEAAKREILEETGLRVQHLDFLDFCPFSGGEEHDLLIFSFVSSDFDGQLKPGDDALDARFFSPSEQPRLPFRCHREFVRIFRERQPPA